MSTDRRSFIGACFAGLAGTAALSTIGPVVSVTRKLLLPESLGSDIGEGPVCVQTVASAQENPAFISILDTSNRPDVWFGLTHKQIKKLGPEKYGQLIQAHLRVNHEYGFIPFQVPPYNGVEEYYGARLEVFDPSKFDGV
jgi:hypothetical protein